jgi:hypothetical protein
MSKVVLDVAMSLDGFTAGPNVRHDEPMGDDGERLHEWIWKTGPDSEVDAGFRTPDAAVGAAVVGRRTFDLGVGRWGGMPWPGVPTFVVTTGPGRTCSAITAGRSPSAGLRPQPGAPRGEGHLREARLADREQGRGGLAGERPQRHGPPVRHGHHHAEPGIERQAHLPQQVLHDQHAAGGEHGVPGEPDEVPAIGERDLLLVLQRQRAQVVQARLPQRRHATEPLSLLVRDARHGFGHVERQYPGHAGHHLLGVGRALDVDARQLLLRAARQLTAAGPPAEQPGEVRDAFDWGAAEAEVTGIVEPRFLESPADQADDGADVERPRVRLSDVGGMAEVKRRPDLAFLTPMRNPALRRMYGRRPRRDDARRLGTKDHDESIRIMHRALDAGINFVG